MSSRSLSSRSIYSILVIYRSLVSRKCVNVLEESLSVEKNYVASLIQRTFRSGIIMDNFQMPLAWQSYQKKLPFRYKLCRQSRQTGLFEENDETVLNALVQYVGIGDLSNYVELHLSPVGRICLSTESILMIALAPSFNQTSKQFTIVRWP